MLLAASLLSVLTAMSPQEVPGPAACGHLPPSTAPAALANDNRTPAGTMRGETLELHLVVQDATWFPEGESGCGIGVVAIAQEGERAQTPAPLIRVRANTRLRVTVRNQLDFAFDMRGLQDHLTDSLSAFAGVEIPAGGSHMFEFQATTPGTYFYHPSRPMTPPGVVQAAELSQAVGAFVVDPAEGVTASDRIFVMTRWRGPQPSVARSQGWEITAFNGRSWPHTERLTATVGDTLRWRIIGANNDGHSMHLHGFYFEVEGKGSLALDSLYAPDLRRRVVTEPLGPGRTLTMVWVPQGPGNWIFHCHLMRHMAGSQRIDRMPEAAGAQLALDPTHQGHAMHEMAGLVLGIEVSPAPDAVTTVQPPPQRSLRLFANRRENVFGESPGFGFVLQDGPDAPADDSIRIPGSLLLLRRGEPTQITVTNRIGEPLSVHWHGLELESYYDGVSGWSGENDRIGLPIVPGDSFTVHITPSRAGTFIYHIHNEHREELSSGLYGPFVVLEPGEVYDPETDRAFVVSEAGPGNVIGSPRAPFVNGTTRPDTMEMVVGRAYRLRIVAIPANDRHTVTLEREGRLEQWRPTALDGADLPEEQRSLQPALLFDAGTGATHDYEFRPSAPGILTLEFEPFNPVDPQGNLTPTLVPIRVREG